MVEEAKFFPRLEHLDELPLAVAVVRCPLYHEPDHVFNLLRKVCNVFSLDVLYNVVHDVDVGVVAVVFLHTGEEGKGEGRRGAKLSAYLCDEVFD